MDEDVAAAVAAAMLGTRRFSTFFVAFGRVLGFLDVAGFCVRV